MSKGAKILVAAATAWPVLYMFIFFGAIFSMVLVGEEGAGRLFAFIMPLHILTILFMFGLTAFYIVDVFRNKRIKNDMKALWAIVIFMGNIVAMPVYWYLFIWKDAPAEAPPAPPPLLDPPPFRTERGTSDAYAPPAEPPDWR